VLTDDDFGQLARDLTVSFMEPLDGLDVGFL
jgi:hypothetical protein